MFTEESLLLTLQYIAYIFLLPPIAILILDRVTRYLARDVFPVYQATGVVGAPIHEASHMAACVLFGLRIIDFKLYKPNRETGQLGYVQFAYKPGSTLHAVGMVVQGIAPLLMAYGIFILIIPWGPAPATLLSAFDLTDASPTYQHALASAGALLVGNLLDGPRGFLWFLIALIIGLHAMPSWADIRIAFRGMWTLLALAIGFSALSQVDLSFLPPGIQGAISVILGLALKGFFWMLEQLTYAVTLVTAVAVVSVFTFLLIPSLLVKGFRLVSARPGFVQLDLSQGVEEGTVRQDFSGSFEQQVLGDDGRAQPSAHNLGRTDEAHGPCSVPATGQTSALKSRGNWNLSGRDY